MLAKKMKRAYIAVPAFLTIGFAAYFAVWKTHAKNRAEEERGQAIEDAYGGKLYRNRNGKKEAEDDIAQGKPKLKEFGLMPAETLEWREVLKERFQVEAESIAGCIVSEPLLKYAHAYNDVAVSYIKKRYGPTALDDAR